MRIKWTLDTGYPAAPVTGEVEVDDAISEEELGDIIEQDMWDIINLSWEEIYEKD